MITYRKYRAEDEAQLRRIHAANGLDFEFPELNESQFVSRWVAEDAGVIVCAVVARVIPEITAFVDHSSANPAMRLEILSRLQSIGGVDLRQQGYAEMQCFVKPSVRGFARRLIRNMRWLRSTGGECFIRSL